MLLAFVGEKHIHTTKQGIKIKRGSSSLSLFFFLFGTPFPFSLVFFCREMWNQKQSIGKERKELSTANQLVSIAVDKDKGSQLALKWATENLLVKGQTAILIHVKLKSSTYSGSSMASPSKYCVMLDKTNCCLAYPFIYLNLHFHF